MRKIGVFIALPVVGALLAVTPAAAQPTPEVTAFCEAALKVDKALAPLFEGGEPSRRVRQRIESALADAEGVAPPEIAGAVQSAVQILRTALQSGREEDFENPALEESSTAINEFLYNSCGYEQVDVTGIEYEFQGLPKTLPAGVVAFRFTDDGAEFHEMDVFRVKSKDSVKKIIGLSEKEQRKKVEPAGFAFATQGQTTYAIVDMSKPGRYGVVCHLPVGSTSEEALEEAEEDHPKSHAEEGMYATITVEKGSTTTTAAS